MSVNISQFFQALGDNLHAHWAQCNFNEDEFVLLAEQALQNQQPQLLLSQRAIVDWVLGEPQLPDQTNINAGFADFNLTAYRNDRFYIELLFWLDGTTSIHQHAFSGAFMVLSGASIHSQYSFSSERRINRALIQGKVQFNGIELLQSGDIRAITPHQFKAHSLYHLDYPNISLVVRTYSEPYAKPQLSYLKPYIAYDPFKNDQSITQKTRLLKILATLDKEQYLAAYQCHVMTHDLYSHAMIFIHNVPSLFKLGALDTAVEQIRHRDVDLAKALHECALHICKSQKINSWRTKVNSHSLKFFLAVLLNAPDRVTSLQLIAQKYPDRSPVIQIIDWIEQLIQQEGLTQWDISEQALPFIECLLEGRSFEQTLSVLSQQYEPQEVEKNKLQLQQIYHDLQHRSVISSLFK